MVFNLDWSKIANDKDFQRLSNHLFSFECNYSGFIPSSPYIGKDGGWDGRWEGTYEGLCGLFSIQSKWTTKNFDNARAHLQSQIQDELIKAKEQKVDHLIITTNAELRVEHLLQLQSPKSPNIQSLQIWHREILTLKLRKHSFLCYYYFGNPQFPAFVPPPVYFPAFEETLLQTDLIGRNDELGEFSRQILSKKSPVAVLHAPGGYGKSHFLKVTAACLDEHQKAQIFFIRPLLRNLQDAFQDELVAGREYILFLDDADRFLEETRRLIALARANRNVTIILACRTAGLLLVKHELYNQQFQNNIIRGLRPLEDAHLREILFLAAGKTNIDKADQIINALDGIPYLVVQYGKRIGKSIADEEISKIHALLGNSVISDSAKLLDGILEKANQEELLVHLATIVPFHKSTQVVSQLAEILKKPDLLIDRFLERLLEGKALRLVGHTIRFYPDMSGDIFLASRISDNPERVPRLFNIWFQGFPSQVLSNLASAAAYERTNTISEMLSRMIRRWIDSVKDDNSWQQVEKLKLLQKIAHLAPTEALDLLHTYLKDIKLPRDKYAHPNLDDFGPLVEILSYQSNFQIKLLYLIKQFHDLNLEGHFDTYKPARLVRSLVSPLHRAIPVIQSVLLELLTWVKGEKCSPIEAEMASEAAKEILSAAHEYTESFRDTVTFGERILNNVPGVHRLRDTAIEIFKQLLNSRKYCSLAVDIAEDIGSTRMHRISERETPLADRIASDRKAVMKELARLDFDTLSPTNVSVIEDLLLKWWLMDKPGAETATNILMRIQRTPQYLFVKRYISPDFVVDDIEQLLREAPAQDRWTWWWDTYGDKQWQPNEKVLQTLVKQLSINYKTPEEIKMFLTEVENLISPLNPWPNPPIVKFWVDETPEPFMELTKTDQWSSIPPRFRGHISTAIVRYNQDYVQTRCREIMGSLPDIPPNELHDFMIMVTANKVPLSRVKDTFLEIAKRSNIQNRGYFIYQLNFYLRDNKDGDSYLELICEATHNELCNDYCNHLAFCLHVLKKDWQISDTKLFDKLRLKIRPLIKDLEELDYHALEVVEFACGSDLDEYTALIEERINVIKAASKETIVRAGYDIIPFDGIPCIKRAINNQERFDRLMGKIVDWNTSDSLRRFDLSYLLKSISDIKDNDQTLMLEVWLRSKFAVESDQSFKEAISVMRLLEFGMLDESCYLLMLETGENLNVFDDAKEVFQWLLDSGLIKSGLGEIPEIFIQKLDACKRLMDKAAVGKVKSYLNECGEQIEQTITDHLSEAQEHLNPK